MTSFNAPGLPMATYWYIKTTKHSTVLLRYLKVSGFFRKRGTRYIETKDGLIVPTRVLIVVVQNIWP